MTTSAPPLRVILNPASSGGRGARVRVRVEEGLQARSVPFELVLTEGPGHGVELAEKAGEVTAVSTAGRFSLTPSFGLICSLRGPGY